MPRLQDLFQTYLREMRPEELRGSAGTYRLREELIARANVAVAPARVDGRAVHRDAGPMSGSAASTAQSDEELAAAWGAETTRRPTPAPRRREGRPAQPARVLNQAEIDSLLGFDDGPAGGENRTGIAAIINSGLVSYERLPMLEIVFDRLVRIMSTCLRNFTSDNVEVGIDNIISSALRRLSELDPAAGDAGGVQGRGVGQLRPDGGRFSAMIYSIVDVLLGGRRGTAAMRIEGRPYTTIERTLVERLIQVVLADLSGRFRSAVPGDLPLRAAGDQPALRHHRPACPTPPCWRGCASTWRIAAAGSSCCCPTPRWSRCASCCCSSSWARNSAAIRSGKPISPTSCGTPTSSSTWCWTSRSCGCPT